MTRVFRVIIICMLANWTSTGYAGGSSSNVSSGCATVEFMAKMVALNIMFPHFRDSYSALQDMRLALEELNFLVCQPVILTANTRYDSRYSNHTLISTDLYDDAWYFPNGQLFMLAVGEDVSVYYPNGVEMSYHWTHEGDALIWPNGSLATGHFWLFNEPWYYPDGNVITYESGFQGEDGSTPYSDWMVDQVRK